MPDAEADTEDPRDLVLNLTMSASRAAIWRCWTEPDLLRQWFAPKPWIVSAATLDVRPGGAVEITMRSPEGQEMPMPGVYLEVVAETRLVTTDAFTAGWIPAEKPFMTAILSLADAAGGQVSYSARARHWSLEDRETHAQMGFEQGWTTCARQLEALAQGL